MHILYNEQKTTYFAQLDTTCLVDSLIDFGLGIGYQVMVWSEKVFNSAKYWDLK